MYVCGVVSIEGARSARMACTSVLRKRFGIWKVASVGTREIAVPSSGQGILDDDKDESEAQRRDRECGT